MHYVNVEKWSKMKIKYVGHFLFVWSLIFGFVGLWFKQMLLPIMAFFAMYMAGQFHFIYYNYKEFKR